MCFCPRQPRHMTNSSRSADPQPLAAHGAGRAIRLEGELCLVVWPTRVGPVPQARGFDYSAKPGAPVSFDGSAFVVAPGKTVTLGWNFDHRLSAWRSIVEAGIVNPNGTDGKPTRALVFVFSASDLLASCTYTYVYRMSLPWFRLDGSRLLYEPRPDRKDATHAYVIDRHFNLESEVAGLPPLPPIRPTENTCEVESKDRGDLATGA